jgi:serine/threonine protein kinase/WD40 repeat protein
MNENNSGPDLLNDLAYEFAQRYRRGERPDLTEYANRHPELAKQIRDLFPALVVMEEFGSVDGKRQAGAEIAAATGPRDLPRQLGEFRILREIGRGGMGVVYEAIQESLGRHVALKVLPFHALISPTQRKRFEREARAAARLHHSNIVPVFGIGEHGGVYYYAMQFIQGQSLDSVLNEVKRLRGGQQGTADRTLTLSIARALLTNAIHGEEPRNTSNASNHRGSRKASALAEASPSVDGESHARSRTPDAGDFSDLTGPSETPYFRGVARLGVQVAEALAYTHRQGIVHRDIKPSNLLLDTQGAVWVTDFGLVKDDGDDGLTNSGDMVGTVRYMAPERFENQGDARSDLYCLGVTLYEMLTLRPPFEDAQRSRLVQRILHEEPVRPRKLDPRIPRDLETIVLKAMAKEPAQRYQTSEEMAEDLRRFLADRPIRARRSSAVEQTWRWCRRNPAVAGLTGCIVVLLAAIIAVKSASVARLQEQLALTKTAELEKTAKLWDSYLAQARASRWSGRVGRRFEGLQAVANAAAIQTDLRLRNEAIALFALPDMQVFKQLPEGLPSVTFDEGFERYAYSDNVGNLSVHRLNDDRGIATLPGFGKDAYRLDFSQDSRFLVAYYRGEYVMRIWDVIHGKLVLSMPIIGRADIDPGSQLAAVPQAGGTIGLFDLASGKEKQRILVGDGYQCCAFHPNGRELAVASASLNLTRIFDLGSGNVTGTLPKAGEVAWNGDGAFLVLRTKQSIDVWHTRTWAQQTAFKTGSVVVDRVALNHAGDLLASKGWDDILRLWDPVTGQELFNRHGAREVQFSRDGGLLSGTFDGARFQVWKVARASECRILDTPLSAKHAIWDVSFSPDGRLLACACSDGVHLFDLAVGRDIAMLDTGGESGGVVFLTDGSVITRSSVGLCRWPVQPGPEPGHDHLRVGPPQLLARLPPAGHFSGLCRLQNGRVAATLRGSGSVIVLDPHNPSDQTLLPGHSNVNNRIAASPDGRWVVTTSFWDQPPDKLRVSDLRTGKIAWTWPVKTPGTFSPDGRWLATVGNDACGLREVGTWRLDHSIREAGLGQTMDTAFSPDGSVLAISYDAQVIRLVDPGSGHELATLAAAPNSQHVVGRMCFSPDGSLLVGVMGTFGMQIWDLRQIRRQLGDLGLDWELPPYASLGTPATPISITVETAPPHPTTSPAANSR